MATNTHIAQSAFNAYIRARDPHCITCGKPTEHCSHIFGGRHMATRFNEACAYGQCARCHFIHHNKNPRRLVKKVEKLIGEEKYDELEALNNTTLKLRDYQLEEIARYYTEKRKVLTSGDGSV